MTNLYFTVTCYTSVDATLWSVCNILAFVSWINKALSNRTILVCGSVRIALSHCLTT